MRPQLSAALSPACPAKPCPDEAGRALAISPSATELQLQQHKNQNIPLRNLLVVRSLISFVSWTFTGQWFSFLHSEKT